jgi:uncharacterized damage-inducible protein DinB
MNPSPAAEREALTAFLDKQRDALVRKIEGLTDDDARLTPTASSMSLMGMLKHCALWERRWFQVIFAGRSFPGEWPEVTSKGNKADFEVGPDDTVLYWLTYYHDQVAESRRVVDDAELSTQCAHPGDEDLNLRYVVLHMIEETARHAGHADIIRETIDGSTGQ